MALVELVVGYALIAVIVWFVVASEYHSLTK